MLLEWRVTSIIWSLILYLLLSFYALWNVSCLDYYVLVRLHPCFSTSDQEMYCACCVRVALLWGSKGFAYFTMLSLSQCCEEASSSHCFVVVHASEKANWFVENILLEFYLVRLFFMYGRKYWKNKDMYLLVLYMVLYFIWKEIGLMQQEPSVLCWLQSCRSIATCFLPYMFVGDF